MDPVDIDVLGKNKNSQMLFAQIGMNKNEMIKSPDEIGLGDPDIEPKQSFSKAFTWAKSLNLNT